MTTKKADTFLWRASAIAGLSGILFGYDASSINDALKFMTQRFHLDDVDKGVVVGGLLAGATIGAIAGGSLADRFGRKRTIIVSGFVFILGALGTALAPDVVLLVLGRLVIGLAIGITSAVTPLYIAEVASPEKRGGMVTLYQLAITIGILVAFAIGAALTPTGNWRLMIALAAVPASCQLLAMLTVPESPRYLLAKGKRESALKVLEQIRGSADVKAEVDAITATISTEKLSSWGDLFTPAVRPAIMAGVGMALIQALTGINAVMYYSTEIFQNAGFKGADAAEIASVAVGVVNVGTTFFAIRLVNRHGRRPLLFAGLYGMVGSLLVGGITLMLPKAPATGWVTIVATLTFVASFAFSLGPIAWLVISEIFPLAIRGRAASFATMANWAANLVVTFTFPIIVANSSFRVGIAYFAYAAIGVVSVIFIGAKVPETRGRSLEEIEADLATGFSEMKG